MHAPPAPLGLRPRSPSRRVFPRLVLALLATAGVGDGVADEPAGTPSRSPAEPSRLTAQLRVLPQGAGGSMGEHDFLLRLLVRNPTNAAIKVRSGQLFLRGAGGWLSPLDPAGLAGTFLKGEELAPDAELRVEPPLYKVLGPAQDAVISLEADDGHAFFCAPIAAPGEGSNEGDKPRPAEPATGACPPPGWPLGLGVLAPLEAVPYADGQLSIMFVGQVQSLGNGTVSGVRGSLLVVSGGNASTPQTWQGGAGDGLSPALWPFVQRLDVGSDFVSGTVSVRLRALLDGQPVEAALDLEARRVEPFLCEGPLRGTWQLSNGPAERQVHANLVQLRSRYAWDFVRMEDGRTYRAGADVGENASYFAWGQSIYAVADGEVVDLCTHQPDRAGGQTGAAPCVHTPVNRIVLRHGDGTHTAYVHLRQNSAQDGVRQGASVKAGQVLAKIGNSGVSSEPHLHFFAFRLGAHGALTPVPVAFRHAFADPQAQRPLVGVPVGGQPVSFSPPPRR